MKPRKRHKINGRLSPALIGLLAFFICRPAWASDEDWAKRAEEFYEKTWWKDSPLLIALEFYNLGASKSGGAFGDRMIESDAVSYSAAALAALYFAMPLVIQKETRTEGREIYKHKEKGFWKKFKEDIKRGRLLQSRVAVPRDLRSLFFIRAMEFGAGLNHAAKLAGVAAERTKAANITLNSPPAKNILRLETSIGMRYGLAGNILAGIDAGVSDGSVIFSRIIKPDGSVLGQLRHRIRAFTVDAVVEWRLPVKIGKWNFFVGAGPSYSHAAFMEAFSWRGNTTWRGSVLLRPA